MKINEILDTTKTWAALSNIEIEIPEELQEVYRRDIEMLKLAKILKQSVSFEQWSAMLQTVESEIGNCPKPG